MENNLEKYRDLYIYIFIILDDNDIPRMWMV